MIERSLAEEIIRGVVSKIGPLAFAVALNNAFTHGAVLEENNYDFSNDQLGRLYEGIDIFLEAARSIEEEYDG